MSILPTIKAKGFTVTLIGDGFEVTPASLLADNQREFLKAHKAEIIQELKQQQAGNDANTFDDRHYCHECKRLVKNRCVVQRFKPTDDVVRRCPDFIGRG
ncbi:MAG: hypothetical protein Q8N96_15050 [Methylovulum sp.]|nr:hypothetical protein [Methylovulum sp.]